MRRNSCTSSWTCEMASGACKHIHSHFLEQCTTGKLERWNKWIAATRKCQKSIKKQTRWDAIWPDNRQGMTTETLQEQLVQLRIQKF
jgi:hypothetical protein